MANITSTKLNNVMPGTRHSARERSANIAQRMHDAMTQIEHEIQESGGVYPHNHHRLSAAEVARRAHVHPTTLHTPTQREIHRKVLVWLASFKTPSVSDQGPARQNLAQRVANWHSLYERLAQAHRDSELALQHCEAELFDAKAEIVELKKLIARYQNTTHSLPTHSSNLEIRSVKHGTEGAQ
ncbi:MULTISPECIES: hypothetical protein [Burkholderia cepacia complex]|uniref:KfrA N-terminal DNA-binding domain-containing protein n=1 Tax=Burkholderia cenocepacia TaxID=95486 RepID=A0ABD4UIH9_9BURK|nr:MULTISPECIES: hypothetical protein [Burkholderia cepacia complex]MCW3698191.1 hypothetical protein [Burkholderia cenocepacia]MCW3706044.1 hypothetical protein [Burkholderia cenocepacia]MCW3714285.1 hypothetical protein [Burkholderia cenocepacia]MCW3722351.1 hypothetical protein [Burkholderia cenocepacia]MCW3730511.1 hypothetical protein [Burkholderia cenocepacia]